MRSHIQGRDRRKFLVTELTIIDGLVFDDYCNLNSIGDLQVVNKNPNKNPAHSHWSGLGRGHP